MRHGEGGRPELTRQAQDELAYYARVARMSAVSDLGACGSCAGAGYVRFERPPGHWMFGAIAPCPRCAPHATPGPVYLGKKQ